MACVRKFVSFTVKSRKGAVSCSERFCTQLLQYDSCMSARLHVYMLSASLTLYSWSGNEWYYPATYTSNNTDTKACKRSAERIRHQDMQWNIRALQVHRDVQSWVDIESFLTVSNSSFSVHPRQRHATFRLGCMHDVTYMHCIVHGQCEATLRQLSFAEGK